MTSEIVDWHADFAVFDQRGQLAAIAEAKKKPGATTAWAVEWFRNYLAHQHAWAPPFVLLVTPDKLYLWKRATGSETSPEPIAVIDTHRVFGTYWTRSNLDPVTVSSPTFEFLVGAWLQDFSHHLWQPVAPDERRLFIDSGLLAAVENGRVVSDIAA
jgi:hypothetical protein